MDSISVRQVDAFTDEPYTGNPAGIVPNADGLSTVQCQRIARELAVSETAFLLESERADYRIRYFTPTDEVDCCGHATIGTLVHLRDVGAMSVPGTITLETASGIIAAESKRDGTFWIPQERPTVRRTDLSDERVSDGLGVEPSLFEGFDGELPFAVASSGLPYLIVPIPYLADLGTIDPDPSSLSELVESVEALGCYCFTFDTLGASSTLHARLFAPSIGIDEDPVTGTGAGAVSGYLDRFDAIEESTETISIEQGHFVDRPGTVSVTRGEYCQIGGTGVPILSGELAVPDDIDDDILVVD